jgi:hypothetical protein
MLSVRPVVFPALCLDYCHMPPSSAKGSFSRDRSLIRRALLQINPLAAFDAFDTMVLLWRVIFGLHRKTPLKRAPVSHFMQRKHVDGIVHLTTKRRGQSTPLQQG